MSDDQIKELVRSVHAGLERTSSDVAAANLAAARMGTQLEAALVELERARNERDSLRAEVTELKARLAGAAQHGASWQGWLGVVIAAAALLVGLLK